MTSSSVVERIRWVAEAIHEEGEFRTRAQTAATQLGAAGIPELAGEFHTEHTPPEPLKARFPGLSDWIAARQFAIFEILYHLGRPSLPLLRQVAHGEYDWTQGNAIEVLCRLAADGVESEAILE